MLSKSNISPLRLGEGWVRAWRAAKLVLVKEKNKIIHEQASQSSNRDGR
jgi:hypothetical protein